MKAYIAIGYFKNSKNTVSAALTASTKKDFMVNLYGNEFVPYVVLTESMVGKFRAAIAADECFGVYDQVKKLATNYRVWGEVAAYFEAKAAEVEDRIAWDIRHFGEDCPSVKIEQEHRVFYLSIAKAVKGEEV